MYSFLDSENVYNRLDDIRQKKGLTIYSLAKRAGVSCASIYKWRDKKSSPSLYLLESLCEVLEISIINILLDKDDLVYLEGDEKELFQIWKTIGTDQKTALIALMKTLR